MVCNVSARGRRHLNDYEGPLFKSICYIFWTIRGSATILTKMSLQKKKTITGHWHRNLVNKWLLTDWLTVASWMELNRFKLILCQCCLYHQSQFENQSKWQRQFFYMKHAGSSIRTTDKISWQFFFFLHLNQILCELIMKKKENAIAYKMPKRFDKKQCERFEWL